MQIIEIDTPKAVNPYAADIATLAEMSESNPKAAGEFFVPTDEAKKNQFKIGKAANEIDKTAALILSEDRGDGTTRLVYRLKARHQSGPRKPRGEVAAPEAVAEVAPEAVEESAPEVADKPRNRKAS